MTNLNTYQLLDKLALDEQSLFQLDNEAIFNKTIGLEHLGNLTVLQELITSLINDELVHNQRSLDMAFVENNWFAIEAIAHKIKSNALYCGMLRLEKAAHHLEQYYQKGHGSLLIALYKQLITTIEQTINHVQTWLNQLP